MSRAQREIINPSGLRLDGRRPTELRTISIEVAPIDVQSVDGSCLYSAGNTRVLATVTGPQELSSKERTAVSRDINTYIALAEEHARLTVEFIIPPYASTSAEGRSSTASAAIRRHKKLSVIDRRSAEYSHLLTTLFTDIVRTSALPNTHIHLSFLLLHNDGSVLATAINAGVMALLHASIPLQELAFGVTLSVYEQQVLVDLNTQERSMERPELVVVTSPLSKKVLLLHSEGGGRMVSDKLVPMIETTQSAVEVIHQQLRKTMSSFLLNVAQQRESG